mmetsp:Transcript_11548/g.13361  ORF Transcript_11548/g.13361 Transcript_11548/m.13361 type:complete len:110 (+) Transcript_11548:111-440(+)
MYGLFIYNGLTNFGYSGGVASLLGFNFCISAKYMLNHIFTSRKKAAVSSSSGQGLIVYQHLSTLFFSAQLILEECYAIQHSREHIDHAAHMIGFAFGMVCYALVSLVKC